MATREQIQQTADLLAVVTDNAMITRTPLAEFPVWLDVLGADRFHVRLRENGRVGGHFSGEYKGCFIQVHTTADLVRDMELPPFDSDDYLPALPVSEVGRLESLSATREVA